MTYDVYGFQQEVLLRDRPPVTQVRRDFILGEVSNSHGCVAVDSSIWVVVPCRWVSGSVCSERLHGRHLQGPSVCEE